MGVARTIVDTQLPLLAAGEYFSDVIAVASLIPQLLHQNAQIGVLGGMNSDVDGDLYLWQSSVYADVAGVVPIAGATIVLQLPLIGGAIGIDIAELVTMPYLRLVYVNGALNQATFRLFAQIVE